jgi:hypothetical protein
LRCSRPSSWRRSPHVIQATISRGREYSADCGRRDNGRTPMGLATALQKIDAGAHQIPLETSRRPRILFIHQPLLGRFMGTLFATHPPTEARVKGPDGNAGALIHEGPASCARRPLIDLPCRLTSSRATRAAPCGRALRGGAAGRCCGGVRRRARVAPRPGSCIAFVALKTSALNSNRACAGSWNAFASRKSILRTTGR